ncbi:MAG: DUF4383 domain-containing protein [Actinomycetota bacterium]
MWDQLTWNQRFGYLFGAVYIVVGLAGFAVTGGVDFAASRGDELIVFEVNPLHNLVHIAVGGLLVLGAAGGASAARGVNGLVGATYLVVGIVGLFMVGESWNFLALNHPDNALHFASALLALGVSLWKEPVGNRRQVEAA